MCFQITNTFIGILKVSLCIPFQIHEAFPIESTWSPKTFWHSHWTGTAKLGDVIPPNGSPGGQYICPRRGGSAFPWGQSTSVQRYLAHIQGTLIKFLHLHPHSFSTAAVVSALLFADFSSEDSLQKARLLFQPLCLEKNALENYWQVSEAFLKCHSWPASLCRRVPERSHPVRSRPSEQRFQLVQPRLRFWAAPHRPQPAALLSQCHYFLWNGPSPPAVPEGIDLVSGCIPDLQLVVEVMETVCQHMHRAGAKRAARSPGLVDGVLGAFCPNADVSAGMWP